MFKIITHKNVLFEIIRFTPFIAYNLLKIQSESNRANAMTVILCTQFPHCYHFIISILKTTLNWNVIASSSVLS